MTGCLDLLFQPESLMSSDLGNAVDDLDIDLDDSDSSLMQEGPLPLPVTMSKLDPVQSPNIVVTSERVASTAGLPFVTNAFAAEACAVGALCKVSVTGLAGAVTNPTLTPYVLVYADSDTYEIGEVNTDGSFATLAVTVPMDEELAATNHILIVRLTENDLSAAIASFPLYVQIEESGNVVFTITNSENSFNTSLIHFDSFDHLYYSVQNADSSWDLWRQGSNGELPLLLVDNASSAVFDILAISEDLIVVFFASGDVQTIEVDKVSGTSSVVRNLFLQTALAGSAEEVVRDGHTIQGPNDIVSYEVNLESGIPYQLAPFGEDGFLVTKPPTINDNYLVAYIPLAEDFVVRLVPYDPENLNYPIRAKVAISQNYVYIWSEFSNARVELSRIQIQAKQLNENTEPLWPGREVLMDNLAYTIDEVDAKGNIFIFSATNASDNFELLLWEPGSDQFISLWNANISQISNNLELDAGVVFSPNGAVIFTCALETYNSDSSLSDAELKAVQKQRGVKILMHRLGVDDPGVFHVIVEDVNADACPEGIGVSDDYYLYYYTKPKENEQAVEISPQLSFVNLYDLSLLDGILPEN